MALSDLTDPTAILKAIDEADALGPEGFLRRYGFGPSREYFLEYQGKRYDSKAIVGVAYGFQHPEHGPLAPHEFSGGEQTVQSRLEALGFTVVVLRAKPPRPAGTGWDLRPGDRIRRVELHSRFGGGGQGGIAPSARTPNVVIFSDKAGEQYGYVFDGWRDGVFYYTGEGQIGDQLMRAGNLAIRDHEKDRRALRVFKGVRGTVEYKGEFRQSGPPYYAEAPDRNGDLRQVIVFRLVALDAVALNPAGPAPVIPAARTGITEIPIEQHQVDSTIVQPSGESREALRREQPMVRGFCDSLRSRNHKVVRLQLLPEGETSPLFCDIYDKTANVVYEAKGSGTRSAIRMAVGQLADYARFAPPGVRRAVLLNERPRPDLERLLEGQGIAAVWKTSSGFADNCSGELATK